MHKTNIIEHEYELNPKPKYQNHEVKKEIKRFVIIFLLFELFK